MKKLKINIDGRKTGKGCIDGVLVTDSETGEPIDGIHRIEIVLDVHDIPKITLFALDAILTAQSVEATLIQPSSKTPSA